MRAGWNVADDEIAVGVCRDRKQRPCDLHLCPTEGGPSSGACSTDDATLGERQAGHTRQEQHCDAPGESCGSS
jgi:hypothetical protein